MSNYLINILTTGSYSDRQESILKTWLNQISNYVFYTDNVNNIGNQISVTDKTSYEYCGLKQINRFKQIIKKKEYLNYDFFIFCDDDTVLNIKNINLLIKNLDINFVYGCVGNTWTPDNSLYYCSGGAGFIVPSKIFKNLKKQPFLYPYDDEKHHHMFGWSDVQAGLFFRDNNFKCINVDGFYYSEPKEFNIDEKNPENFDKIKEAYSFHYIRTHEQRKVITDIFNN
jgi:hypothetical protein